MSQVTSFVICFLMGALRSRLSLQLEVAALRHQLSVYQGAQRRPPISSSDRLLWSMIASVWSGWRKALFFVQPRTVLAWQHKRFRDHWRGLSGGVAVVAHQSRRSRGASFDGCGRPIRAGAPLAPSGAGRVHKHHHTNDGPRAVHGGGRLDLVLRPPNAPHRVAVARLECPLLAVLSTDRRNTLS